MIFDIVVALMIFFWVIPILGWIFIRPVCWLVSSILLHWRSTLFAAILAWIIINAIRNIH